MDDAIEGFDKKFRLSFLQSSNVRNQPEDCPHHYLLPGIILTANICYRKL
jgi:hypothetical protein